MAVSALLSRALFDYFQNYLTYFQLSYQYLVDFQDRNITPSQHHRSQTELSEIPFFSYSQINPAKIESSVEHILVRLKPVYLQVIVALLVYI
jgi:hypothetical protein